MSNTRTVKQYILSIRSTIVPDNPVGDEYVLTERLDVIQDAENMISDELPDGYYCKIEEA